jgi:hypothetical protein
MPQQASEEHVARAAGEPQQHRLGVDERRRRGDERACVVHVRHAGGPQHLVPALGLDLGAGDGRHGADAIQANPTGV